MFRWSCAFLASFPLLLSAADPLSPPSAMSPENVIVPGHSMQGESFDEGPRRAARLLGTTGRVIFPITTSSSLAQQFFNQGIGQLHGFWYFEAERSFRQAAKLDPDRAMPYFGMSLANVNNEKRAKGFLTEAVNRKGNASERERLYIDALDAWYKADIGDEKKKKVRARNFVDAIEEILFRYPEDMEAKAMLCLALWQHRSDLEVAGYFSTDALINDVIAANPYHPIHHIRVHLWDNDKAKIAVNSAERCGLAAPGIAHMWHMSGHTYSELHQYFDAAWHQEASARTDHAYMIQEGVFPDRIHNFAHNNEWLVKNLQYLGRIHDAIVLAKNTIELPQHPKLNPFPGNKSAHFGRLRLFQIYSNFEFWDQLIADAKTQTLGPTSDESEQVKYFRQLGRAYFRRNDLENGKAQLAILENRLKRVVFDSEVAADAAVAKAKSDGVEEKEIAERRKQALQPTAEKKKTLERAIAELQGYIVLSDGKPVDALEKFNQANDVDDSFMANVEFSAGQGEASLKRLREWVGRNKRQVRPLASLVEMLWKQEKKDEAKITFEELREISGAIDLDVPSFARLQPIASQLGYPADWRKQKPVARNAAELPELSTLGPFTWQPESAPDWSLPDQSGQLHSLAEFGGRPLILIFYLGYGCLHCAQQLQAFAPMQKEYSNAGISLIAVSSDTVQNLKKSQERYKSEGEFPFLLLSDSNLEIFKRYRAYDDFEEAPLHATILIDGAGKIRWHDSGADPFMDVGFLLNESKRLLYPGQIELPKEPVSIDAVGPPQSPVPQADPATSSQPVGRDASSAQNPS